MRDPQVLRQEELEQVSMEHSIKKYREALRTTALSEVDSGIALLKDCIEPMVKALKTYLKIVPTQEQQPGRREKLILRLSDPEVLAFLTAKRVINTLSNPGEPLQHVCVSLADMVRDNYLYEEFKKNHPGYLHVVEDGLKTSSPIHKRKVYKIAGKILGITVPPEYSEVKKLHIGRTLIDLFVQSTGVVSIELAKYEGKATWTLVPHELTLQRLEKANAKCELLYPRYFPMVIRPQRWESPFNGGFLANIATMRQKLVKTRNSKFLELLSDHEMPQLYDALNTLQETKWRINRKVYDVFEDLWDLGGGVAGLPTADEEPLPPKPWADDDDEPTKEQITAWSKKAAPVYDRRVRDRSKRAAVLVKKSIVAEIGGEPEIYFCYTMDWRGRVYPLQNFIHPQADDSGRALIEFAEGKELGEHGAYWLAVHGANCYGIDKGSFDDRVKWVTDHENEILDSASDSVDGSRFWCDAENPFQFLAFCFEWAALLESGQDGKTFVSHLPVGVDGSCNGLQNFSALLLDPVGGAATNLVPADKPNDIYQEVADVLNARVDKDAREGDPSAVLWQGKITRKITKRGVMTTPYGAKKYGLRQQLRVEMAKIDPNYLGTEDDAPAVRYLADRLYDAIGEVVVAARLAMDWLQTVAKVCSESNTPIEWTTPIGFRPVQEYKLSKLVQIKTVWGGVRVDLGLRLDKEQMDKRRQENGISPNFIHSLDASHMMMTVNRCREQGITSFSMVHDSYAVHAGNINTLNQSLRKTFVELYSEDRLAQFYSEVAAQLPPELIEKIPAPPVRGTLDLGQVEKSCYFFA